MKKILLTGVALTALGNVSALAADLPRKAPVAPAPVAYIHNWSGFYIGGHIGYGSSDRCLTVLGFGDACSDADGFLGGGQIGWNIQTGNNFVFGIEFSGSFSDIGGDNNSGTLPGGAYFSSSGKSLLMLTGRVGMAFDRTLFYITGGGAWARNSVDFFDGGLSLRSISTAKAGPSARALNTRSRRTGRWPFIQLRRSRRQRRLLHQSWCSSATSRRTCTWRPCGSTTVSVAPVRSWRATDRPARS